MSKLLPATYAPLLADLKARVRAAQVKAVASANRELILLYWHMGREIVRLQKVEKWGAKLIERLARDLVAEFPEMGGFSRTNILRMRAFYLAWRKLKFVPQPVGQLGRKTRQNAGAAIVPRAVRQLGGKNRKDAGGKIVARSVRQFAEEPPEPLTQLAWGTNVLLIEKVKNPAARHWYACKAVEHGWSRAVLAVQIESRLHQRSGKAITNFDRTLPPSQSDMARELLKDPYTFDFLTLGEAARERDLENGLVQHVQKLLMEMGEGFAFVGRQVPVEVGDETFFLDLLFFHLRLRCFVVVDLKMKPFEPEFAGKMNFYLSAVDAQLRHADDAPTIGLLLCQDAKNRLKVEYALRDVKKPMGVAEWQTRLVEWLPKELSISLPTIEALERELNPTAAMKRRPGKKSRASKP